MFTETINVTNQLVVEEIENVLDTYSYHLYQQAFSIPNLRQKLIAYVLSQVHKFYTVLDDGAEILDSKSHSSSLAQRLHIEPLIRQGIIRILQEDAGWVSYHIPKPVDAGNAPSHWFG